MVSSVGWRSFWWLNVGINIFAFFAVLVGFPETKWHRPPTNDIHVNTQTSDRPSKDLAIGTQHHSKDVGSAGMAHESAKNLHLAENANTVVNVYLGKSKPSKWQWKLLQPAVHPLKSLVAEFLIPWKLLLYPIVQFASFVVSFSSTFYLMINLVQSEGLGGKPYHFGSLTVGFTNFACLVGTLIGLFTAGPASDYISAVLTKRNKGIREPEMRLVTMIPYVLIMVLGNFVVAFGLQHLWDWRVSRACVFSP